MQPAPAVGQQHALQACKRGIRRTVTRLPLTPHRTLGTAAALTAWRARAHTFARMPVAPLSATIQLQLIPASLCRALATPPRRCPFARWRETEVAVKILTQPDLGGEEGLELSARTLRKLEEVRRPRQRGAGPGVGKGVGTGVPASQPPTCQCVWMTRDRCACIRWQDRGCIVGGAAGGAGRARPNAASLSRPLIAPRPSGGGGDGTPAAPPRGLPAGHLHRAALHHHRWGKGGVSWVKFPPSPRSAGQSVVVMWICVCGGCLTCGRAG